MAETPGSGSPGRLRPIGDDDLTLLLSWRNLPDVRKNMITSHVISWEEHLAWWAKAKVDPSKEWYFFLDEGEPVAVLNFYGIDREKGECYWGFYLGPEAATAGRSRLAIWLALEETAADHAFGDLGCRRLLCETMAFNTPVLQVHRKFGFEKVGEFETRREGKPETLILMALDKPDRPAAAASPAASSPPPQVLRVALLGSANWDLVARELVAQGRELGSGLEVVPVPFGQYQTLMLDPGSVLRQGQIDFFLFCERLDDLLDPAVPATSPQFAELTTSRLRDYLSFIETARGLVAGQFLVLDLAPIMPFPASLQDATYRDGSARGAADALNRELSAAIERLPDSTVISLAAMVEAFGRQNADPRKYWFLGRMAVSAPFGRFLGRRVIGAIQAIRASTARVLVLDLDNTLWGGVLGDDGLAGIQLGGDFPGNAYLAVQRVALALKDRGIALAVCSKNSESIVRDAFERHEAMALRMDDFAATRINWQDKAANLRELGAELGLGLASLCFIDDSPYEREAVRRALPDVVVPELPPDVAEWPGFLLDLPCLAYLCLTAEDRRRAEQYRVRSQIQSAQGAFETKEAFWESLRMRLRFLRLDDSNLDRTIQLLAKTNQFNTTTRRHSQQDLRELRNRGAEIVPIELSDRYSAPEIVGVLILVFPDTPAAAPEIESFVLSCRVLGRSVETGVLGWACSLARSRGAEALEAEFIPTPRNEPAAAVYAAHGFTEARAGRYVLPLEDGGVPIPSWFEAVEGFDLAGSYAL